MVFCNEKIQLKATICKIYQEKENVLFRKALDDYYL